MGAGARPGMTFSSLCPLNVLDVMSLLSPPVGGSGQACPLSLLQSAGQTLALAPGPMRKLPSGTCFLMRVCCVLCVCVSSFSMLCPDLLL